MTRHEAHKLLIKTRTLMRMIAVAPKVSWDAEHGYASGGYTLDYCVLRGESELFAAQPHDEDVVLGMRLFLPRRTGLPMTAGHAANEEAARMRLLGTVVGRLLTSGVECRAARWNDESAVAVIDWNHWREQP